jgi:hypothetical protein
MTKQPYETWTLLTNAELIDGAAAHQFLVAHAHAEAVRAMRRGLPDYAVAWQKVQADHYRAAAEFMRFLLRRAS